MLWPLHADCRQPDWNEYIWHLLPQAKSFSLPHCNISPADCNFLIFMFRISFGFLEILYFMTTLWSQFPAMIIIVTGTHQYFIHNTLGGSKESPLPRKIQDRKVFLFCPFVGIHSYTLSSERKKIGIFELTMIPDLREEHETGFENFRTRANIQKSMEVAQCSLLVYKLYTFIFCHVSIYG